MKIYAENRVSEIRKLFEGIISQTDAETTVKEQLEMIARQLVTEFDKGNEAVATVISNWHPDSIGIDRAAILNLNFSEQDAYLTIAREHGFTDWNEVEKLGDTTFNLEFENAVDTLLKGDRDLLALKVSGNPALIWERSKYGHQATLLHYVSNNGCETRRQVVPLNLPEIAGFLTEKGADKDAKMHVYGGEFTALELAATSAHTKDAGILDDLIEVLEEA